MLLGQVPKQPTESFKVGADFWKRFDVGEVLVGITATSKRLSDATDSTSTLLTQVSVSGTLAMARLRPAGADGEVHRVQMRVVTSLGNTYEAEIDVAVKGQ